MFRWLKQIWMGSDPVEFDSSFGMDASVERLKEATSRWGMFNTSEVATGTVTESRVSLQRKIPMVSNSFKPFFVGSFERSQGKVVLRGRFTLIWPVKIFMTVWLGFCAFFTVVSLIATIRSPQTAPTPFVGLGMLVFGLGLVGFGSWLSRNDSAWLSRVIRTALDSPTTSVAPAPMSGITGTAQTTSRPTFILAVTGALVLFGLLVCASAITGIQSYRGNPDGAVITHYAHPWLRDAAGIYGVMMLALALGVYRRSMFAWRMGFVVFTSGIIFQAASLTNIGGHGNMLVPGVLFCIFSVIVAVSWGRWWYAQRVHFHN